VVINEMWEEGGVMLCDMRHDLSVCMISGNPYTYYN